MVMGEAGKEAINTAELPARDPGWQRRAVFLLALVGLVLRLVTIDMPLVNNNGVLRQTQTADATAHLHEGGWGDLSAIASWRGDLEARILLELPVYNYAAAGAGVLLGDLTGGGRVVSALCWLSAFLLVQPVWRRLLGSGAALWANVGLVLAPLAIAYGQAFSPEMLLVLLSVLFVRLCLRYHDRPTVPNLAILWLAGMVAVLVKVPSVSHLYVLFGFVLFLLHGFRAALVIRYWVFAVALVVVMKFWVSHLNAVNSEHFALWSASGNIDKFLGNLRELFELKGWIRVAGYVTVFLLSPVGVLLALLGLRQVWRARQTFEARFLLVWTGSLLVFYLVWGPRTAFGHAYYNIVALLPLMALFGIGARDAWAWLTARPEEGSGRAGRRFLLVGGGLGHLSFLVAASVYLLWPDWAPYRAGQWLQAHTAPEDLVLAKDNHRPNTVNYFNLPTVFYHANRDGWHWAPKTMPAEDEAAALRRCQWLVELKRVEAGSLFAKVKALRFKEVAPESLEPLREFYELTPVAEERLFRVFRLEPRVENGAAKGLEEQQEDR